MREKDEVNPVKILIDYLSPDLSLSCSPGITSFVPAKVKFYGVIFWP